MAYLATTNDGVTLQNLCYTIPPSELIIALNTLPIEDIKDAGTC